MDRPLLVWLCAFAFCSPCLAAWEEATRTKDGVVYLIDADRIQVTGKVPAAMGARAWIRADADGADPPIASFSYAMIRLEFACSIGQTRQLHKVLYDKNGTPVEATKSPGEFEDVVPDTVQERLFEVVCAHVVLQRNAAQSK